MEPSVRLDRWLWAVRIYKTRTLAADACRAGWVTLRDEKAKPAREVRCGDVVRARVLGLVRTFRVIGLPHTRLGAAAARECVEDLTPPEEIDEWKARRAASAFARARGSGRPTKKERRELDQLRNRTSNG